MEMKWISEIKGPDFDYLIDGILSRDEKSTVYKAFKKDNNQCCYVKLINKTLNKNKIENALKISKLLLNLKHESIPVYLDVFETKDDLIIVTEFYDGTTLKDVLIENAGFTENCMLTLFHQLVDVLDFLHCNDISHLDLRPEKILILEDNTIKLFGFTRGSVDINEPKGRFIGSPLFTPPEYIINNQFIPRYVDLYCLGILLYVLIAGDYPFKNCADLNSKILQGLQIVPENIRNNRFFIIIQELLSQKPEARPDLDLLMHHPSIHSFVKSFNENKKFSNIKATLVSP